MNKPKTEFFRYGNTIVASFRKPGQLRVYSLAPKAQHFEPDVPMLSTIYFDRSGLAEKISRTVFKKIARERGIQELPLELQSVPKTRTKKKVLEAVIH